jgi:hypothetical protein
VQKSRAYRATNVKGVSLERIMQNAPAGAVSVGLDVGKEEIYAVVRWSDGTFERPWKALNPSQVPVLVEMLGKIGAGRPLTAAMESTGTYGDALRARLGRAGVGLHRVSGKAASDYAEVLDGVPSQHDGKDAAIARPGRRATSRSAICQGVRKSQRLGRFRFPAGPAAELGRSAAGRRIYFWFGLHRQA